jgi:hypothetical protein
MTQALLPSWFSERVVFAEGQCWEWTGFIDQGGYGQIPVAADDRKAHRFAYTTLVGPIPEGMTLDHLCKCRHCVNPVHLEVVTRAENTLRSTSPFVLNKAKTHCLNGHPLTGANLITKKDGRRNCLQCRRDYDRQWKRSHRA